MRVPQEKKRPPVVKGDVKIREGREREINNLATHQGQAHGELASHEEDTVIIHDG
jgi:hypothetical protein